MPTPKAIPIASPAPALPIAEPIANPTPIPMAMPAPRWFVWDFSFCCLFGFDFKMLFLF